MELDVVIPLRRPTLVDRVLRSFARGSDKPSRIMFVSNDLDNVVDTHGLDVRIVSFETGRYAYGDADVVLRRNVGIWASQASHVLLFDDDQLAPYDLIATASDKLRRAPVVWGNYRYVDFAAHALDEIVSMPPEHGRSRERPPNAWHAWMSGYGGAVAFSRALVQELGGFDMAYLGRHAGEDQQLARRIARHTSGDERIFVHEPPFVWHPITREPWGEVESNTCAEHTFETRRPGRWNVRACGKCPAAIYDPADLMTGHCLAPFDPAAVKLRVRAVGAGVKDGRE